MELTVIAGNMVHVQSSDQTRTLIILPDGRCVFDGEKAEKFEMAEFPEYTCLRSTTTSFLLQSNDGFFYCLINNDESPQMSVFRNDSDMGNIMQVHPLMWCFGVGVKLDLPSWCFYDWTWRHCSCNNRHVHCRWSCGYVAINLRNSNDNECCSSDQTPTIPVTPVRLPENALNASNQSWEAQLERTLDLGQFGYFGLFYSYLVPTVCNDVGSGPRSTG